MGERVFGCLRAMEYHCAMDAVILAEVRRNTCCKSLNVLVNRKDSVVNKNKRITLRTVFIYFSQTQITDQKPESEKVWLVILHIATKKIPQKRQHASFTPARLAPRPEGTMTPKNEPHGYIPSKAILTSNTSKARCLGTHKRGYMRKHLVS